MFRKKNKTEKIKVKVEIINMSELLEKANKYHSLLQEAKSISEELASCKFEVVVKY